MRTKPGSSVPLSLSRPVLCPRGARPLPTTRPQLSSATGGLPTASTPGPEAAGPWRPGCRGAPRGQSKAMASAHCKGHLHPVLPWVLRTGQPGEPASASWEKDKGWPGRGQQVRGALWSGCPGKASPARRGGAKMCPMQGSAMPTALQVAPIDQGGGGGLDREAGPLEPRAGLRCAHPALHAGEPGASCLRVPRTLPPAHRKGWRQRRFPPRGNLITGA